MRRLQTVLRHIYLSLCANEK